MSPEKRFHLLPSSAEDGTLRSSCVLAAKRGTRKTARQNAGRSVKALKLFGARDYAATTLGSQVDMAGNATTMMVKMIITRMKGITPLKMRPIGTSFTTPARA